MSETPTDYKYANTLQNMETQQGFSVQELDPSQRVTKPLEEVYVIDDQDRWQIARDLIQQGIISQSPVEQEPNLELPPIGVPISVAEIESDSVLEKLYQEYRFSIPYGVAKDHHIPEQFADRLESASISPRENSVYLALDNSIDGLDRKFTKDLESVSQVFTITNGNGANFTISNFSKTPLTGAPLKKLLNAVANMDHLTGGFSSSETSMIAILPKENTGWGRDNKYQDSTERTVGLYHNGIVYLNELLLEHEQSSNPYTKTGEHAVAGDDIEAVTTHELTHLVESKALGAKGIRPAELFGWKLSRDDHGAILTDREEVFEGEELNPSEYGRTKAGEDTAESSTGMSVGGEWSEQLDAKRKAAIVGLYATAHTGIEGPSFVRCTELDLAHLEAKIGSTVPAGHVDFNPAINFWFMK